MQKFMFFCFSLLAFQSWSGTGCMTKSGKMCYPSASVRGCDCVNPPQEETLRSRIKEHFKDKHQRPIKTYINDKQSS